MYNSKYGAANSNGLHINKCKAHPVIRVFFNGKKMNPQLAANSSFLQGGAPLSLQGSSPDLQPAYSGLAVQDATSPMLNMSGSGGIPLGSASPAPSPSPAQPGYGSSGAPAASNRMDPNVLGGLYDQQVNYLQNYRNNAIPQYQGVDQGIVQQGYDTQKTNLDAQHALGQSNLQLSQNRLDTQRTNSIRDLGTQLRGLYNGYNNQIGVLGAGDSSAAPLLSYALQQQGNTGMNDLNTQYGQQQSGINLQGQGLETNYQGQTKSLDNWKNTNLQQIAENYSKQMDNLNQQIMSAQGDKARFLSLYGTQALASQALSQMQALNQQYMAQINGIHQSYGNIQAPNAALSQYTQGYNVAPFSQQQLGGLTLPANQAAPQPAASLPANFHKQPGPLAPA